MAEVKDTIQDLTQKLFTEAGYPGNVYHADPKLLKRFEAQALKDQQRIRILEDGHIGDLAPH